MKLLQRSSSASQMLQPSGGSFRTPVDSQMGYPNAWSEPHYGFTKQVLTLLFCIEAPDWELISKVVDSIPNLPSIFQPRIAKNQQGNPSHGKV